MGPVAARHLRRHHLPGAGAAGRQGGRRLRPRRGGLAAPRDDEGPLAARRWSRSAAHFVERAVRPRRGGGGRRGGLPPARGVRRVRLLQGARGVLRGRDATPARGCRRTSRPSSPPPSSTTSRWASTRPRLVLDDARRHGIEVLPPHVNALGREVTVEQGRARDPRRPRVPAAHDRRSCSPLIADEARAAPVRRPRGLPAPHARATSTPRESLIRVGALDGLGVTDAGRPPTRDEMLALLPELKAVLAREGVAGDRTLVLAPGTRAAARGRDHVSGWSVPRRLGEELQLPRARRHLPPARARARRPRARAASRSRRTCRRLRGRHASCASWGCASARRRRGRARAGARASSRWRTPTGLLDVIVFEDALKRCGETIVKHRCYLVEGTLQNNPERGLAIVARRVEPYVVARERRGSPVRLRRGVGQASLGPFRGGGAGRGRGGELGRESTRPRRRATSPRGGAADASAAAKSGALLLPGRRPASVGSLAPTARPGPEPMRRVRPAARAVDRVASRARRERALPLGARPPSCRTGRAARRPRRSPDSPRPSSRRPMPGRPRVAQQLAAPPAGTRSRGRSGAGSVRRTVLRREVREAQLHRDGPAREPLAPQALADLLRERAQRAPRPPRPRRCRARTCAPCDSDLRRASSPTRARVDARARGGRAPGPWSPKTCRAVTSSSAASSPSVRIPRCARRSAVAGPMPGQRAHRQRREERRLLARAARR